MTFGLEGTFSAEVKCKIQDPDEAIQRLVDFGAELRFLKNHEHDIWFAHPTLSIPPSGTSLTLRERIPFSENLLFLKKESNNQLNWVEVSSFQETKDILIQIGFVEILELTKIRSMFGKDDFHFTVDTVKNHGSFLEIGANTFDAEGLPDLNALIRSMVVELGYENFVEEFRSYKTIIAQGNVK